ncbi:MAG: UDP-N-acetylmuramate dehydrogenase [Planctomycetaceae bacterium]|jgi:UDP-N-acetylmuramate dehydrogenase|nr:UDP-N-acetylmuramate dehydrogenase [Planctomycetaceae bacterium]
MDKLGNSVRQDIFPGARRDVPLAMYTRLQLGGLAEFFAEPASESDLAALLKQSRISKIPVHILGAGSNLLVSETGITGLTIRLSNPAFCGITIEGQHVIAGTGAKLGQVITQSVSQGLGGIEDLIGIPGSLGGSLLNNAGTNSGDLGQWVESVRVADINGEISVLSKNEISFSYRSSSLDDVVILSATLRLEKENPAELTKRMQKLWIIRKTQQPGGELASVYVFKNPAIGTSASDLIEQAGLKGTRIGGAVVSERNANFIMVEQEGTTTDVLRLIRLIQEQVEIVTETKLELSLEVW